VPPALVESTLTLKFPPVKIQNCGGIMVTLRHTAGGSKRRNSLKGEVGVPQRFRKLWPMPPIVF
jgi:hypothetical protein